jgi:hypothetical protein
LFLWPKTHLKPKFRIFSFQFTKNKFLNFEISKKIQKIWAILKKFSNCQFFNFYFYHNSRSTSYKKFSFLSIQIDEICSFLFWGAFFWFFFICQRWTPMTTFFVEFSLWRLSNVIIFLKVFTRRVEQAIICTIWNNVFGKIYEKLKKTEFLGHFFSVWGLGWIALRWIGLRWIALRWIGLRWIAPAVNRLRWIALRWIVCGESPVNPRPS